MKDAAVPDAGSSPRPLGEILLEHGFVTQEQLDHASDAQERTGKPLGQVLVEAGSLTRLELASALAEQWSNTGSWLAGPSEEESRASWPDAPATERGAGDDALAALAESRLETRLQAVESALQGLRDRESADVLRLQEAVLEVARRIAAVEPAVEQVEARAQDTVTAADLAAHVEHVDGAVARLDGFQSALAVGEARLDQLANTFDATVARQDEATTSHQAALHGLGERVDDTSGALDELRAALAELAARPAGDPALAQRLDELAARPAVDPALAARVEELAASLDELAHAAALESLRAAVDELAARPAGDPGLETELRALGARVDALPDAGALEELRAAVAELHGKVDGLADLEALGELRSALEEVAARPASDAELLARIVELSGRVDALTPGAELDELRAAVEELSARPAADPALADRLEELSARVASLADLDALTELRHALDDVAARPVSDVELAGRVTDLASRVEALPDSGQLDGLRGEVAALADAMAGVARTDALDGLQAAVAELAARPAGDPQLAARVAALAEQLDSLVPRDPSDPRVDELVDRVASLEESAGLAGAARDPELEAQLAGLQEAVARLASDLASARDVVAQRPERASAVAALQAAADGDLTAVLDQEVERLRMAIERMGLRLGEHDRALVELMQMRMRPAAAPAPAAVAATNGSVELSDAEAGDVQSQVQALAFRLARAEEDARSDREKAFKEIERVASSLVWRLQRLESRDTASTT